MPGQMCFLLAFLTQLGAVAGIRLPPPVTTHTQAVSMATAPQIYHCWSPNMEHFTCWWRPVANVSDGEDVSYTLHYSRAKGPLDECPDYVSGGPHSCHFDRSHTSIWKVYCMTVTATAAGARWNTTSQPYCVDVADIVQTEAPVNLSYVLRAAGGDEVGHSALLSWTYPAPEDLQYGWITLLYELQYRRLTESGDWKAKPPQKESRVELVGLPVGDYLVRVRCRSNHYGLWSRWSATLRMSVPARPLAGKMLVLILVVGVGTATLLVVCFGVLPQGKRIKAHLFPPIPKPRIGGIDPKLLKKGRLDEIDQHFRTFHSYTYPTLGEEVWNYVSAEDGFTAAPPSCALWPERPPPAASGGLTEFEDLPASANALAPTVPALAALTAASAAPYCGLPPAKGPGSGGGEGYTQGVAPGQWAWPAVAAMLPASDYSLLATQPSAPQPPEVVPLPRPAPPPADLYTCAQHLSSTGEVNLVPSLVPDPRTPPGPAQVGADAKPRQLADYLAETRVSRDPN